MYYYIAQNKHDINVPFAVYTTEVEDFYKKRIGNSFNDKIEAETYCFKLNKILWQRSFSFKDKNGNDVHVGDYVKLYKGVYAKCPSDKEDKLIDDIVFVLVRLVAEDGSSFMFYDDDNNELFINDFSKVELVKEH